MANATLEQVRGLALGIALALQEGAIPDQSTLEGMADDAARASELLNQFIYGGQSDTSGPCHACGNHVADTMARCGHCDYDGNEGRFTDEPVEDVLTHCDRCGATMTMTQREAIRHEGPMYCSTRCEGHE